MRTLELHSSCISVRHIELFCVFANDSKFPQLRKASLSGIEAQLGKSVHVVSVTEPEGLAIQACSCEAASG